MNQKATTDNDATNDFPIDVSKVDPALVNRALKTLKLDNKGDFEERIERLKQHLLDPAVTADEDLLECGECHAPSNAKLFPDACCFCGKVDEAPAASAPKVDAAPPAVEAPTSASKPGPKKAQSRAKLAAGPPPKDDAPAIVVNQTAGVSEIALDAAIKKVRDAQSAGAMCYWDLGEAIRDIYDRRLYTQRRVDGKPKYASWDAFVKAELGISKQHVFTLMDVSKNFDRKTFTEVGITKLALIGKLSPEVREELVEKARKGLPTAQVSEDVRRLMEKGHKDTGSGRKDPLGSRRGKQSKKAPVAPPKLTSGQLTAVVTSDRTKIPLFARPKANSKEKPARAMKVAQDPSGVVELVNGVELHVRVVLETRGLVAVVEFR